MNKLYGNGETTSKHIRPKTAPCAIGCPVEVDHQPKCNEYTPIPPVTLQIVKKKKKLSFWKSLFKERKCPTCTGNCCDCKRSPETKKKMTKQKCPTYKEASKKNPPFTSNNTQTNENCPTKCTLPINQRGVGCHMYFCIDSKPKKQTKAKKNKRNETIQLQVNNELPQVTVICDDSEGSLELDSIDRPSDTGRRETIKPTTTEKGKQMYQSNRSYTSLHSMVPQNNVLSGPQKSTEYKTGKEMFLESSQNYSVKIQRNDMFPNLVSNSGEKTFNEEKIKEERTLTKSFSPSRRSEYQKSDISKTVNIEGKEDIQVLNVENISPRDKRYHLGLQTTQASASYPVKAIYNGGASDEEGTTVKKYNFYNKKLESVSDGSNDMENNNFSSREKQRKYSRKRSTFVRNSLITLRRSKRESVLEDRVSLILRKLTDIENKIEVIEKCTENKEKHVKVGISCNSLKKNLSIKFDDTKSKSNKDPITSLTIKPSKQPPSINNKEAYPVKIKPSYQALKDTVRIKSHSNNISIQAPGDVNITTKSKKKPVETSKSKQVLYHNSYEMDAHIVGTNSNLTTNQSFKCHNPKIVVSYPMKENQNPDSWRKISEELKISQGNIVRPENCHCTKYFRC